MDILGTILMVGLLFGSLAGGPVGDKFGRKKALLLALVIECPSIIIGGFISNYEGTRTKVYICSVGK